MILERVTVLGTAVLVIGSMGITPRSAMGQHQQPGTPQKSPLFIRDAMLGSWEQTIKDETDAESDDPASTVDALIGTSQDFHIYQIDTETDWTDFQDLVAAAAASGSGLKLYAAMDAPHLSYAQNRWFDTDGDGVIGDPPPDYDCGSMGHGVSAWECQRKYIRYWLDAWTRAARDLSSLSASYPDVVVGFAINDFELYVEQPAFPTCMDGLRLSKSEIGLIYEACHENPKSTLGFYPVMTFPGIGRFISPGVVLGTDYGVRMSDTDEMTVRFTVPLLPDPYAAKLKFFQFTDSEDTDLHRSLWVGKDGKKPVKVWCAGLDDEDRPDVEYFEHSLDLDSGINVIELKLYATPTWDDGCGNTLTRGCGGSGDWWHVWDISLEYWAEWDGAPAHFVVPLSARFETTADPDPYCAQGTCVGAWSDLFSTFQNDDCRCYVDGPCTPFLPDNPIDGRLAKRLVCGPNDAYLIEDVIDGIIPYVTSTDLHGPVDALDPNLYYGRLLRRTKQHLGDKKLIAMHTAFPGIDGVTHAVLEADTDVLVHRVLVAAGAADGAGVYRFPLPMYFMDPSDRRGIFAETSTGTAGKLLANWPTDQAILPGWYQRWVHQPPGGTPVDMTVEMWDNRDASSNWGKFVKAVSGGGLSAPYEVDPYDDGTGHEYIPADGTYLTSTTADPVVVGMSATSGTTIYTWTYFSATDSSVPPNIITDWTFESGVDNPHTVEIYERLVELFKLIHGP